MKIPNAPKGLSSKSKKFWRDIHQSFEILEPQDLQLLLSACECLDRISQAQKEIKVSGPYYQDRFGQPKENPGHKTERDNKILFTRLIRELQLDIEPPQSRPPGRY